MHLVVPMWHKNAKHLKNPAKKLSKLCQKDTYFTQKLQNCRKTKNQCLSPKLQKRNIVVSDILDVQFFFNVVKGGESNL